MLDLFMDCGPYCRIKMYYINKITWTVLSLKWACLHRGKKSFNMGYPITTQFSWDDDDDFHRYFGAQVVYDTFSDELRAGYAARIQARQAWLLAVDHGPDMSWS